MVSGHRGRRQSVTRGKLPRLDLKGDRDGWNDEPRKETAV